jgi:hypothetical protein
MSTELGQVIDAHLARNESVRPEELPALTRADRCDNGRCTAAALIRVLIPYGKTTGSLDFCDHHYREHQAQLVELAGAIRDERHLLEER